MDVVALLVLAVLAISEVLHIRIVGIARKSGEKKRQQRWLDLWYLPATLRLCFTRVATFSWFLSNGKYPQPQNYQKNG